MLENKIIRNEFSSDMYENISQNELENLMESSLVNDFEKILFYSSRTLLLQLLFQFNHYWSTSSEGNPVWDSGSMWVSLALKNILTDDDIFRQNTQDNVKKQIYKVQMA